MSRAYDNAADARFQQGGRRNLIINGAMTVSQRNGTTDTTVSSTGNVYTIDRWAAYVSQASKISVQQSTDTPANFKNSAKVTVQSAVSIGAGDYFGYNTQLEGQDVAHLNFGTSDAQKITISFWVKSSLTGTFGLSVREQATSPGRSFPTNYTISAANTWEYKTLTIDGDTGGTWSTDNTAGLDLWFDLGTGSSYQGAANQWNPANDATTSGTVSLVGTASATWYITGVQLEVGNVATPFEHRSYGEELALCQRYYVNAGLGTNDGGVMSPSVDGQYSQIRAGYTKFPVTMRAAPDIVIQSSSANSMDRYGRGQELCYPVVEGLKEYSFTIIRKKTSGGDDSNWTDSGTYINRAGYSADAEL